MNQLIGPDQYDAVVNIMETLAREAGAVIIESYKHPVDVMIKADQSPVTQADKAAEAIILTGLDAAFDDICVVAEEQVASGSVPGALGRQFFLVDALDGTKEFVNKRSDFTVNIALIDDGVPVLGVVYAPVTNILYKGQPDRAGKIENGNEIHLRMKGPEAEVIAVASHSHRTEETNKFLRDNEISDCVSVGSSLKFGLVAEGKAHLYPRFGRTMEWDTAAGDAVLRAAGGKTVCIDGALLRYGKRNQVDDCDFANPHFVSGWPELLPGR